MRKPSEPRVAREDLAAAPRAPKMPAGPVPTLRDMHRIAPWLWVGCRATGCHHDRPVMIVHLMIALGVDASSDAVRARAVCPECGHRGATLQVPSHANSHVGLAPFPGYEGGP